MSRAVRRVKIGKLYDGSNCCWCGELLFLGDDGVICEACGSPTHTRCWDTVNKCNACNSTPTFVNQPLPQPLPHVEVEHRPRRTLEAGESFCASCGDIVQGYCFRCRYPFPQAYTGPKRTLPEANEALRYAIIGVFCFGFVLGPLAIVKGTSAKKQIAADPRWDGEGTATAAQIIGGIEVGLYVLYILAAIVARQ